MPIELTGTRCCATCPEWVGVRDLRTSGQGDGQKCACPSQSAEPFGVPFVHGQRAMSISRLPGVLPGVKSLKTNAFPLRGQTDPHWPRGLEPGKPPEILCSCVFRRCPMRECLRLACLNSTLRRAPARSEWIWQWNQDLTSVPLSHGLASYCAILL